jgi:hypothetical protein
MVPTYRHFVGSRNSDIQTSRHEWSGSSGSSDLLRLENPKMLKIQTVSFEYQCLRVFDFYTQPLFMETFILYINYSEAFDKK